MNPTTPLSASSRFPGTGAPGTGAPGTPPAEASTDGHRGTMADPIPFELPDGRIAEEPIEATGVPRDRTRLLVVEGTGAQPVDAVAAQLPRFLDPGDVIVVNTSATLPAAVPTRDGRLLHVSSALPGGLRTVELREPCGAGSRPSQSARPGDTVPLPAGGSAELLAPFPADDAGAGRLWTTLLRLPQPLTAYLDRHGHAIRYGCGERSWPISAYQTVFATEPGSSEMPSAARPFTPGLVTDLVRRGVVVAPLVLHTGVSSLEAHEPPYPEPYRVPAATADLVNAAHDQGRRVIAVGTTATRAIETTTEERGQAHPGRGWTDLVVTPERGVRAIDGIISGWHEPEASHLLLMEAVAGRRKLERSYRAAIDRGYRWHEFGDLHLVLP